MAKITLEAALLARRDDPRALRGAITIVKGKPRIVFGVVGDHPRFSLDVNGNKIKVFDDPRGTDTDADEPAPDAVSETTVQPNESGNQRQKK
jgi:hypothetical protein